MTLWTPSNPVTHQDGHFQTSIIKTIQKNTGVKLPMCSSVSNLLYNAAREGVLTLHIEDNEASNCYVVYEKLPVLTDFINASVLGNTFYTKNKAMKSNNTMMLLDSYYDDPDRLFICMDSAFKSGENVFVLGNTTTIKNRIGNLHETIGGIVMSGLFPDNYLKEGEVAEHCCYKQLVSLNLLTQKPI